MYRCEVKGCGKVTPPGKKLLTIIVTKQGKPGFSARKPDTPIPRLEIQKEIKACAGCKLDHVEAQRFQEEKRIQTDMINKLGDPMDWGLEKKGATQSR